METTTVDETKINDRARAAEAARRIEERRKRLGRTTLAELIDSIHEGHRY
jgi:hypothetical protein